MDQYFLLRGVTPRKYDDYRLPAYVTTVLPPKDAKILDFGCGFGQLLRALHAGGYPRLVGADVNEEALSEVRHLGIDAVDSTDIAALVTKYAAAFDLIVMSHVLEHLPKQEMISVMAAILAMLAPAGRLLIMVPNAQSSTGCYWAFEDFTHTMLFTSGSLSYVLRAAGFSNVTFIDVDCTAGLGPLKRCFRRGLLRLYRAKQRLWNAATGSAFHAESPAIYSYEIKALATR